MEALSILRDCGRLFYLSKRTSETRLQGVAALEMGLRELGESQTSISGFRL